MSGRPARVVAAAIFSGLPLAVAQAIAGERLSETGVVIDPERPEAPFTLRGVSRLADATADVRAEGVRPPMRVMDAQRFCPALGCRVVPASAIAAEVRALAELSLAHVPLVEVREGALLLELTGIPRAIATQIETLRAAYRRAGHRATFATSPGPMLSLALARAAVMLERSEILLDAHRVPDAIRALPLGALEMSADLCERLRDLGLDCAGDLARLRGAGLAARLEDEAPAVLNLLAGDDRAPLAPYFPPAILEEHVDIDPLVAGAHLENVEPILFLVRPLVERLLLRLRVRQQRMTTLSCRFQLRGAAIAGSTKKSTTDTRTLSFPSPVDDSTAILRALKLRLEKDGLPGETHRITLTVTHAGGVTARQQSFAFDDGVYSEDAPPRALSALLAELVAELGDDRVGCLRFSSALLPERMSGLSWPPPKAQTSSPEDRAAGGRFGASWPWPVALVPPAPLRRAVTTAVRERHPFCVLEGEDETERPFLRQYEVVVLDDGRRALAFRDPEDEAELMLQGWF